jgi:hypothetical protein
VRPRRERARPEAWLLAALLALVLGACEKKAEEVDVGAAGGERDSARDEADVPAAPAAKPASRSQGPVLNRKIFEEANAAAQAAAVPAPVANMEISDVPADILGVRLGATQEEAVAALGKLEPKPEISVSYAATTTGTSCTASGCPDSVPPLSPPRASPTAGSAGGPLLRGADAPRAR